MKLLFVLSEYLPESGGGIITFYRHLLPRLVEHGCTVDVIVAREDLTNRLPTEVDGVRVQYVEQKRVTKYQTQFQRFRHGFHILKSCLPVAWAAHEQADAGNGYDVVEATDWGMLFAPWIAESKTHFNLALHSSAGQMENWAPNPISGPYTDFVRLIETEAVRLAHSVQTNSRTNANFWHRISGREVPWIPPIAPGPQTERASDERQPHGVIVGRIQQLKGPELICEALRRVRNDVEIKWIGRDTMLPDGTSLEASLRSRYPEVVDHSLNFTGPMDNRNVLHEMAKASFACIASEWDVFNMTAVEAIQSGTPLICSSAAGAELLLDYPGAGLRFESGSAEELAACLDKMVAMDNARRKLMSVVAKRTLSEVMSPEIVVRRRIESYKAMAQSRPNHTGHEWFKKAVAPTSDTGAAHLLLTSFSARQLMRSLSQRLIKRLRGQ